MSLPSPDVTLDELGTRCPGPVLALGKAAKSSASGTVIAVLSDDPAANQDIAAWCRMKSCELIDSAPFESARGARRFLVRLG